MKSAHEKYALLMRNISYINKDVIVAITMYINNLFGSLYIYIYIYIKLLFFLHNNSTIIHVAKDQKYSCYIF